MGIVSKAQVIARNAQVYLKHSLPKIIDDEWKCSSDSSLIVLCYCKPRVYVLMLRNQLFDYLGVRRKLIQLSHTLFRSYKENVSTPLAFFAWVNFNTLWRRHFMLVFKYSKTTAILIFSLFVRFYLPDWFLRDVYIST